MCGRYTLTAPADEVRAYFQTDGPPLNLAARYNVAPTQGVPVVRRRDDGRREMVMMRWGLVPSWSQGPDSRYSMLNARAETVAQKPAFREALRARRCIVPADGFYEWKKEGGRKQPYRIVPAAGGLMGFAGLWEDWRSVDGRERIISTTIIVTAANDLMRPIHDRMPVILPPEQMEAWLDPETSAAAVQDLLAPMPADALRLYPVSTVVNAVRHDGPECIAPLDAPPEESQPRLL